MMEWVNDHDLRRLLVAVDGDRIRYEDLDTDEVVAVTLGRDFQWGQFPEKIEVHRQGLDGLITEEIDLASVLHVGKGVHSWGTRRLVWSYVTKEHCQALRVGLTVHEGIVSSTPHPFELMMEMGFEEAFYFLISPPTGKVILEGEGVTRSGSFIDKAWPVRHKQLACIPMGYHRVIALPGGDRARPKVAYWWGYLSLPGRNWEK